LARKAEAKSDESAQDPTKKERRTVRLWNPGRILIAIQTVTSVKIFETNVLKGKNKNPDALKGIAEGGWQGPDGEEERNRGAGLRMGGPATSEDADRPSRSVP